MNEIYIRDGVEDDIPTLIAIEHDAGELFRTIGYDFCADGPARDVDEHRRGIRDGALLVAETNTRIMAGFALLWSVDGHAHLTEISVAHQFQGCGIGKKFLVACEEWARSKEYAEITLTSFRDVAWNAPFYSRQGFEVFTPSISDKELLEIIESEAESGFAEKPRVAMKKRLL